MSPARLHRERLAAAAASIGPNLILIGDEGGQPASVPVIPAMTPAREHRLAQAVAAGDTAEADRALLAVGIDPYVAQLMLRLQHDLRRLKDTKAIERKIAAKAEMLPDYRAFCDQLLAAGRDATEAPALAAGAEILPTMMVWSIDVGDWPRALELAEHVIRLHVPLPARYERDAATLVLEEIAEAAFKVQDRGDSFPLDVLEQVAELTDAIDMHDQPRAKLARAIGFELAREAAMLESGTPAFIDAASTALMMLQRAQQLHDRIGVKTKIKRLEKALAAAPEQPGSPPADTQES